MAMRYLFDLCAGVKFYAFVGLIIFSFMYIFCISVGNDDVAFQKVFILHSRRVLLKGEVFWEGVC